MNGLHLSRPLTSLRSIASAMALALFCLALSGPASARSTLGCSDLSDLVGVYLQKHFSARSLDAETRQRAAESYLRRVDSQRTLLLADEARKVTAAIAGSFDAIARDRCVTLTNLHRRLADRHDEVEQMVRGIVEVEGYGVDETAKLVLDPDDRGHPRTAQERLALLRTLVHFQVSNYLATDIELPEAKRRLVHRYELATRRWKEQDEADLFSDFLEAFGSALDPHSGYLSAEDLEDFQIGMQLSLEGIGVSLSERDGYAVVEQVIPGGAADRVGKLLPGDKFIAVANAGGDPVDVIDMALRDVVRLIRGKKGSTVRLTVLRQGETTERFNVAIVRDKIDLEEQAAKLEYEEVTVGERTLKLAVLELPSFYGDRDPSKRQCSRDVERLLREANEAKVDGLLLDLSRNGGGLLEDAVRISGFFIREGGVVGVKDSQARTRVLRDPDDDIDFSGPMVVLTSRVSASASEILAGALKDYRRAVIVGDDHTFGKGTVQSVVPLKPGLGAIRVTTAVFFRPGGLSTQNVGVDTDVVIPSLFNSDKFGESTQRWPLPSQSIAPFRSQKANAPRGAKRWRPVRDEDLRTLAARSKLRVEKSEIFLKINEELAERESDDGVIQLAEILREREEARAKEGGSGTEGSPVASTGTSVDKPEDPTPQLEEAIRILTDLVLLDS